MCPMKKSKAIHYQLDPVNANAHLLHVSCRIPRPDAKGQQLSLPAWIPGSYLIREFARHIVWLKAECNGQPVAVEKIDKATWLCAPVQGELLIRYEVYAFDLSVRGAYFDSQRLFFNGTSVFLQVAGQGSRACIVDILPPKADDCKGWRVATALPRLDAPKHGFGTYIADDYDELIDHPVEIGHFDQIEFKANGVAHELVIAGRHSADLKRLARDMKKICAAQIDFFGGKAPFERYVFLVLAVGDGYGGLEHRASTALICSRDDLPRKGQSGISDAYRTFLGLVSHEYFHTWNVKRIKPAAFVPYELSRENYTRLLWAFEGITSYYDDLFLLRCGLIGIDDYLKLLAQTMTGVQRGAGRLKQTLEESSLDAWSKYYRQDENSPNSLVSYYTKGALAALLLDLQIRRQTRGRKSLDDVMYGLWQHYLDSPRGVSETEWEQIAGQITGLPLQSLFDRLLRSTEELPLADALAAFAIELQLRPAESAADKGGKYLCDELSRLAQRPVLGVRSASDAGVVKLTHVLDGGAAQAAGLAANDVLIALDGLRVTPANLDKMIESRAAGDTLLVHAFRRDELMTFKLTLKPAAADTVALRLADQADAGQLALRQGWLGRPDNLVKSE
jgi:predicted metalloprotease with PDZ domain